MFPCTICESTFSTLPNLKRHEVRHSANPKPFSCDICKKKFTQSSTLKVHQKEVHQGIRTQFNCNFCSQTFTRQNGLKYHIANSHSTSKCDDKSSNIEEFQGAAATITPSPGDTIIIYDVDKNMCPFCQKIFKHTYHRNRHILKHTTERPFKCEHCNKSFYRNDDLKHHIESHLNVKRFKSKYCDLMFRHLKNQKYHEKQHEEHDICNSRGFFRLNKMHRKCELCSETVSTPFLYEKHFMDVHNREFSICIEKIVTLNLEELELSSETDTILVQDGFNAEAEESQNESPSEFGQTLMAGNNELDHVNRMVNEEIESTTLSEAAQSEEGEIEVWIWNDNNEEEDPCLPSFDVENSQELELAIDQQETAEFSQGIPIVDEDYYALPNLLQS